VDYNEITLATVNKGAMVDLFNEALEKILDNIADENYPAEVIREITLTLKIKPGENREVANTQCHLKTKLANLKPIEDFVVLSYDGKNIKAYQTDPKQMDLEEDNNVIKMDPLAEEAK
jgi:hypothetical protein